MATSRCRHFSPAMPCKSVSCWPGTSARRTVSASGFPPRPKRWPGIFHFGRDEKTPFAISNKARERVAQDPRTVPLRWSVELVTTMGETATARAFGRLSVDASASASAVAVSDGSELLSGCSGLARRERLAADSATRLVFLGWLLIKAPSREHPLKRPGTASPSPVGVAVSWPGLSRHLAWSSWQRLMLVLMMRWQPSACLQKGTPTKGPASPVRVCSSKRRMTPFHHSTRLLFFVSASFQYCCQGSAWNRISQQSGTPVLRRPTTASQVPIIRRQSPTTTTT